MRRLGKRSVKVQNASNPISKADGDKAVDEVRNQFGIDPKLNVAYAEVNVGLVIDEPIAISGRKSPVGTVPGPKSRLFDTFDTPPGHFRGHDAEVKLLEAISRELQPDAVATGCYSLHKGTIRLYSHFTICASCDGVIAAFRAMFSAVDLVVSHG